MTPPEIEPALGAGWLLLIAAGGVALLLVPIGLPTSFLGGYLSEDDTEDVNGHGDPPRHPGFRPRPGAEPVPVEPTSEEAR